MASQHQPGVKSQPSGTRIDGVDTDNVPADDRGLAYADGVFRTLVVSHGDPVAWAAQYQKLAADCAALAIKAPDASDLHADIQALFEGSADGVARITVTRFGTGRGYAPPLDASSRRIVSASPMPDHTTDETLALAWSSIALAEQPALAGIKHLARLEQVLARAACRRDGIDDAVMCDTSGRIISTTMRNLLFLQADGRWSTPRLDRAGIAGVTRGRLMDALQVNGTPVAESTIEPAGLDAYVGAIASNSVGGVIAVERIGSVRYTHSQVMAERANALLARSQR